MKLLYPVRELKQISEDTVNGDMHDYPVLKTLYDKLMPRGGKYISFNWIDMEHWVNDLIMFGEFTVASEKTVSFNVVKASKIMCLECFYNAYRIVEEYGTDRLSVVMGMSLLKNENLWMQHTWIKDHEYNIIIETTPTRSAMYYGIEVDFDEYGKWVSNEDRFMDFDDWKKRKMK